MRTVWKFHIPILNTLYLDLPEGATFLKGGAQSGVVVAWFECDVKAPPEQRKFYVTGTGHPVPEDARYLDSIQEGVFAWHLWEAVDD